MVKQQGVDPQPREPREAPSYASSPGVRRRMQLQKTRDTAPELELRRRLHALGLRYRVDAQPLPELRRRADVVFTRVRLAVFVDGCFWHGCPDHGRREHSINGWYWPAKIAGNRAKDADTNERLRASGWEVVRVWEHDDMREVAQRVADLVAKLREGHKG